MMNLIDFPRGAVINSYGESVPGLFTGPLKHVALSTAYASIRGYQKRKYRHYAPPHEFGAVHSTMHLGKSTIISTESPVTVIKPWDFQPGQKYTVHVWKGLDLVPDRVWDMALEAADKLNGTKYDYGQLVDFWLEEQLRSILPPPFKINKLSLLDLGRNRKVCSATVATLLLILYKESRAAGWNVQRPLIYLNPKTNMWEDIYAERTCPADFNFGTPDRWEHYLING